MCCPIFQPQMTRITRIFKGASPKFLLLAEKKYKICVIRVICG